jgi:hypothetical protein
VIFSPRLERFVAAFAAGCLLGGIALLLQGQAGPPGPAGPSTKAASSGAASQARGGASAKPPSTPKIEAPASVSELLKAAQGTYRAANTANWTTDTAKEVAVLQSTLTKVKADLPQPSADQQNRLEQISADLSAISAAVSQQHRREARDKANRLWRVSGVLADSFVNKVPQGLWQMQYLAREIDVWSSDPADMTKLKTLAARLDSNWATLRKEVTAKTGPAQVKAFTDQLATLKAATAPEDYARLVKPVQATLERFEQAYQ